MKNKVINLTFFTEFSKKIGMGHYVRSRRLHSYIKKYFNISFYSNKSEKFIKNQINKKVSKRIFIFDLKNYDKLKFNKSKTHFYIFFDRNAKNKKNIININPLLPWSSKYGGPKWFSYPSDFFKERKIKIRNKNKVKKILICQGGTDAHNNVDTLINIFNFKFKKYHKLNTSLHVLAPNNYRMSNKIKNDKTIKFYKNIKKMSKFLVNFDHIVTACGSLSYEINSLGIDCTYITSEPREIKLAKYLDKKNFGKYFNINQKKKIFENVQKSLMNNNKKNYLKNKIRYFRHNGLRNILNLLVNINYEI